MSIKVEHLTHIYNKGLTYETKALDDVSFEIEEGAFAGIIGHTGSGKSTLIQHFNGILKPESGKIWVNGTDITEKGIKMTEIRKRVGLVFQYPEYQLFEETVAKDIAFGPMKMGLTEEEIDRRVRDAMELVSLEYDVYAGRSPFELSGGQKRRVAIAGVLAMKPSVLILDEPTAGLDPQAHREILDMLEKLHELDGCTVILVSHNMEDMAEIADRIIVMERGKVVLQGTPREVYGQRELLENIGLETPAAMRFTKLLEERGISLPGSVMTMDETAEALLRLLRN
ncbi:MAG: energy-coupling factor transporter ATPase [Firmicutes bacterium]|nr:energy-coupling factor transporter ATPase [Bacillota bacterium]